MSERIGTIPPLWKWITAGVAMDAGALLALYALLVAACPLRWDAEFFLAADVLMAVPWFVHVVALPAIFRLSPVHWKDLAWRLLLVHRFHEADPRRGIPSVTGRLVGSRGVNVVAGHHGSTSSRGGIVDRLG